MRDLAVAPALTVGNARALTPDELKPDATPGVQEAIDADFLHFRNHPHRRYRLRQASPAERFEAAMAGMRAEEGEGVFVVSRAIYDDIAIRAFLRLPIETETDIPEEAAKLIHDGLIAVRPNLAKAEADLEELAEQTKAIRSIQERMSFDC